MGMFKNLFSLEPDFKIAAREALGFVVSLRITDTERDVMQMVDAEPAAFIAERTLLFAGLTHSFLIHFGDSRQNEKVMMVRHYFDEYIENHFRKLPGVDANYGANLIRNANKKYTLANFDSYPGQFIAAATENRIPPEDCEKFPEFLGQIDGYKKVCCEFLAKKIIVLNKAQ